MFYLELSEKKTTLVGFCFKNFELIKKKIKMKNMMRIKLII